MKQPTQKHIIQFYILKGQKYYVAEGVNFPVITQGKTLDELVKNIKEAVNLALENEDLSQFDLAPKPTVLLNFELMPNAYA